MCALVKLNDLYFLLVNLVGDFDRMFLFVIKLSVPQRYTSEKRKNVMEQSKYMYLAILNYSLVIQ